VASKIKKFLGKIKKFGGQNASPRGPMRISNPPGRHLGGGPCESALGRVYICWRPVRGCFLGWLTSAWRPGVWLPGCGSVWPWRHGGAYLVQTILCFLNEKHPHAKRKTNGCDLLFFGFIIFMASFLFLKK